MKDFCESKEILFELLTRILCDVKPPRKADIIYLFAETADNENSVINQGVSLFKGEIGGKIGICAMNKKLGYPGAENWSLLLRGKGVRTEDIIGIELAPDFPIGTDAEALGLIRAVKARDWKNILIVAPPLHQVRTFISTVSASVKESANIKIYNCVGQSEDWLQDITHSQGTTKGKRKSLLAGELSKIIKYHRKGDLISAEEIISYLNQRDN